MSLTDYAFAVGLGLLVVLVAAFPLVTAAVVVSIPGRRPSAKFWFVLVSGVVAYGVGALFLLVALFFRMTYTYLGAQLQVDGYGALAHSLRAMSDLTRWLPVIAFFVSGIAVPIYGRLRVWERIHSAVLNEPTGPMQ